MIYLGTLSKKTRRACGSAGWAADHALLAKLNLAKQAADLCSSTLSQRLAIAFLSDTRASELVNGLRGGYRSPRDALCAALARHLPPGSTWVTPEGGLFLWASLPEELDRATSCPCLSANVAFVPGRAAYLDGQGASSLRLNYSAVDEDALCEGARRIGAACEEQLALVQALAPPAVRRRP